MKNSMREKLAQLDLRQAEIDAMLQQPDVTDDINNYRKLSKEHAEITPVVETFKQFTQTEKDIESAHELLTDPDFKTMAQEEIQTGKDKLEALKDELQTMLLPKDENDERNIVLEIRAGTGGDESALFAGDLLRMYTRYAERQRWQTEIMSESVSDLGGYREVIVRIAGLNVYSKMKFESGGHRVQRVPETEAQGRIHTSACTVAVMPEADEIGDVHINPADLRIDTFRASGAGGQHINKTDSAVRIVHIPTGTVVECQDGRSQHSNKATAMKILVTRIRDAQVREQQASEAATRKSLVGSGDRSERIRTYNFPQGRITDHRVNLTWYKIDAMLDGDLDDMFNALSAEHQAEQLAALGDE
ncbi:peptide chain release factor 1 [Formosimonas limnophila]|uniref:Peptide chain release factor 1 n=1 Tax=Formosimonas limnophila TaxID=1384487 RepID=A0A8J3CP06_9BURK|nr:peptide chain release factor 1 [Formosimonas limnophila]GHA78816.1 peptide chain release factor 1 [Formosimonas limnophila]